MRSCDGCTKCCEGWLTGEAHGYHFWPGRKCHFCAANGCSIYETRPVDPCVNFRCAWLADPKIPEWMKPSECDAIIVSRKMNGFDYIDITEAGGRLDSRILSWFVIACAGGQLGNLSWQVDGGRNWIGSEEFITMINAEMNPMRKPS